MKNNEPNLETTMKATFKTLCTMRTLCLACVLVGGAGMALGGLLPWYVCLGITMGNCWTVLKLTK